MLQNYDQITASRTRSAAKVQRTPEYHTSVWIVVCDEVLHGALNLKCRSVFLDNRYHSGSAVAMLLSSIESGALNRILV